jgi:hypothetical protein
MLSDALHSVGQELWPALATGSVGDRAGAEWSAFAKRALLTPALVDLAEGHASVPDDPDLIYFLGASCLAALGKSDSEEGTIAARALVRLAAKSMEIAVWTVESALRRSDKTAALEAFLEHIRGAGAQVLVDVLCLSRHAR